MTHYYDVLSFSFFIQNNQKMTEKVSRNRLDVRIWCELEIKFSYSRIALAVPKFQKLNYECYSLPFNILLFWFVRNHSEPIGTNRNQSVIIHLHSFLSGNLVSETEVCLSCTVSSIAKFNYSQSMVTYR
jgi:hypothetical protein